MKWDMVYLFAFLALTLISGYYIIKISFDIFHYMRMPVMYKANVSIGACLYKMDLMFMDGVFLGFLLSTGLGGMIKYLKKIMKKKKEVK